MVSCNLHVIHNAFGSGLKEPPFTLLEEYADNVYKWFKQSTGRREEYKESQELLQVSENYFLQYVSCRWLTIIPVLQRLVEQHAALEHYFLRVVPQKPKSGYINNIYVSNVFSVFLKTFQADPLVHILYD